MTTPDSHTVLGSIAIAQRGDALRAVPDSDARVAALLPATVYGPGYLRRVVDELDRARRMWEVDSAGSCLVTAEIAAGLRPESDYLDRHNPAVYICTPT